MPITTDTSGKQINGNSQDETLIGTAGDDSISGGGGRDLIEAGAGNDLLLQNALRSNSTLDGGIGIDTVTYSLPNGYPTQVVGRVQSDLSAGLAIKYADNQIPTTDALILIENVTGSVGNDTIAGDANANVLQGGGGNDLLSGRAGDDTLDGGAGDDTLDGGSGSDMIAGGEGNDTVLSQDLAGDDLIDGGNGDDALVYILGTGASLGLDLPAGRVEKYLDNVLIGTDTLANVEHVLVTYLLPGSEADDSLTGAAYNDTLSGGAGNDTLDGGNGRDLLNGGSGSDVIGGGGGDDLVLQDSVAGNDTIDGGAGIDTLDYSRLAAGGSIIVNLAAQTVDKLHNGVLAGSDSISNIEWIAGSSGNDWIVGQVSANNVTISGGEGRDTLDFSSLMPGVRVSIEMYASAVWKYGADYRSTSTLIGTDVVTGIENFIGSGLGDQFLGGRASENFQGGVGDDHIEGREGNDTLSGGGGNDTLSGGEGSDLVSGGDGDDLVVFYYYEARSVTVTFDGSDTIDGGAGRDTLDYSQNYITNHATIVADLSAGTVNKYIAGAYVGTDTIRNVEKVIANNNDDVIIGSDKDEVLDGGAGNDTLDGGGGNDLIIGGRGSDLIVQRQMGGNDTIDGGTAYDANYDTIDYSQAGDGAGIALDLPLGVVRKFQDGVQVGSDTLIDVDFIIGTRFADTINGSAGDDRLMDSDAGNDLISGFGGNDYLGQKIAAGDDTIDGGDGNDTVDYSVAQPGGSIAYDLASGTVRKFLGGVLVGTDTLRHVESVIATREGDTLLGSMEADLLDGGAGNDRIVQVDMATGDTMNGGSGIDTVDYSATPAGAHVEVDLASGIAAKWLDGAIASTDILQSIEVVIGSAGADIMDGSTNADLLDGAGGNDQLYGGAGNDTLVGGSGDNVLAGGEGDDVFREVAWSGSNRIDGGDGNDTVDYRGNLPGARLSVDLSNGTVGKYLNGILVGTDTLHNIEFILLTGNDNTIIGSAGADMIVGDAGNDSLQGAAGNDTLDGGNGNDVLGGGSGDDLVQGGAGNDLLDGGAGNDMLDGGDGDDRMLQASDAGSDRFDGGNGFDIADYSGAAEASGLRAFLAIGEVDKSLNGKLIGIDHLSNVEGIIGTNGYDLIIGSARDELIDGVGGGDYLSGGAGNDTLRGGAGNDMLDGGSGNDLIDGGDGDDHIFQNIYLGNNVTIDGGAGDDTVDYGQVQVSPDTGDGAPTPVSGASIIVDFTSGRVVKNINDSILVGTDYLRNIEHVVGTRYGDFFDGGQLAIVVEAGGGNDIVYGSQGADTLSGGTGNDWLDGRGGNNVLTGGSGNDTVIGGVNDDRFVQDVSSGSDLIRGDAGFDTIDYFSADIAGNINADLAAGSIKKYLSGQFAGVDTVSGIEAVHGTTGRDRLKGSAVSEWLSGDAGDDAISGGAGNDTLIGGAGNDSIDGGAGDDWVIQDHAKGSETMDLGAGFDTVDYSRLEAGTNIRFDGSAGQTVKYLEHERVGTDYLRYFERIIGSAGNDKLIGNGHADAFDGGAGDDVIDSGGGNDTLDGGAGNDTITAGDGTDIVRGGAGDDRFIQEAYAAADRFDGGEGSDTIDCSGLYYTGPMAPTIRVDLAQGTLARLTSWNSTVVVDSLTSIENIIGSAKADAISGNADDNSLSGGGGNDTLSGLDGNDVLSGDDGNDSLQGGAGNDVLIGGKGNDQLLDSDGSDTFVFGTGFGQDVLINLHDAAGTDADTDTVVFNGINADKLLFQRVQNDLKITVSGQADMLTLKSWYGSAAGTDDTAAIHPVDLFVAGDQHLSGNAIGQFVTLVGAAPVSMSAMIAALGHASV